MNNWHPIADGLANALRRTEPYLSLLPKSAAAQIRAALDAYDLAVADEAIVQRPHKPMACTHEFGREMGRCMGCGELVE